MANRMHCILKKATLSIHTRCAKCAKCQIFGTPNTKKIPNIRCFKSHNFCNKLQYPHIFGTVRIAVAYGFIIFLFPFLSHPNYLFRLLLQLFTASIPTCLFLSLFFFFFFLKVTCSKFLFLFFKKMLKKIWIFKNMTIELRGLFENITDRTRIFENSIVLGTNITVRNK